MVPNVKKFSHACVLLTIAVMGANAAAAEGQDGPALVMYENVGMSGREVTYRGPVADIDVKYPFNAAKVLSGEWEVCTRNDFQGACMVVGSEIRSIKKEFGFFARVRSLRPVQAKVGWEGPANGGLAEAAQNLPVTNTENLPLKNEAPAPVAPLSAPAPVSSTPKAAAPEPVKTSAEAALMGHGVQFFKTPMLGGHAINADDEEASDRFCREAGLESAAYVKAVTVKGRRIVGDLLCESGEDADQ